MIDSYLFGSMVIDGKRYNEDLILLPDGAILSPWWRHRGHGVAMSDIREIVACTPDILIVGTGSPGLMKPDASLGNELEIMGIAIRVLPTKEAAKEFNSLCGRGKRVAGCFHLTC